MPTATHLLVLRPGALGDALLSFPALAALRRRWPTAHVTFAARPDVLALARSSGLADETRPMDDPIFSQLWRSDPATGALATLLRDVDTAIAWVSDADSLVASNLRALGVARVIVAPGQPAAAAIAAGAPEHVACYLLHTLVPLGIALEARAPAQMFAMTPTLVPPAEDARRAALIWQTLGLAGARVVALHPGSGGAAKCWPAERFAVLAAQLWQGGYVPLVLVGPADAAVAARLLAVYAALAGTPAELPLARDLEVPVLAGLLARCAAFAGNDAGVTHLAALVGCPTLALFGPSDPARWAPIGRRVLVLRAPADAHGARDMAALSVEAVMSGLMRLLTTNG
jgi:ADP-heptose:LPS heptosyltransferase